MQSVDLIWILIWDRLNVKKKKNWDNLRNLNPDHMLDYTETLFMLDVIMAFWLVKKMLQCLKDAYRSMKGLKWHDLGQKKNKRHVIEAHMVTLVIVEPRWCVVGVHILPSLYMFEIFH